MFLPSWDNLEDRENIRLRLFQRIHGMRNSFQTIYLNLGIDAGFKIRRAEQIISEIPHSFPMFRVVRDLEKMIFFYFKAGPFSRTRSEAGQQGWSNTRM